MTTDFKTPRIKIVLGWPFMAMVKVGEILKYVTDSMNSEYEAYRSWCGFDISLQVIDDYPIHFKTLLWNEERTEEELAEVKYVKVLKDDHRNESVPYYGRIKEWLGSSLGLIDNTCGGGSFVSYKNCEPCTEQDYLTALK